MTTRLELPPATCENDADPEVAPATLVCAPFSRAPRNADTCTIQRNKIGSIFDGSSFGGCGTSRLMMLPRSHPNQRSESHNCMANHRRKTSPLNPVHSLDGCSKSSGQIR